MGTYGEFVGVTHKTSSGPFCSSYMGCDWLGMLQSVWAVKPVMLPSVSNSQGLTYLCPSGLLAPDMFSAFLSISRPRTQPQLLSERVIGEKEGGMGQGEREIERERERRWWRKKGG